MTISKRHFLIATAALAMTATLHGTLPAIADGQRTAGRTDFQNLVIVLKGDINTKISLSKPQMEKFNRMKMNNRSAYIDEIISRALKSQRGNGDTNDKGASEYFYADREAFWCGKCNENDGRVQHKYGISGPEFKDGISAFITASF